MNSKILNAARGTHGILLVMKVCLCDKSALEYWRRFDNRVDGTAVFGHTLNAGPLLPSAYPSSILERASDLTKFGARKELFALVQAERNALPGGEVHVLARRSARSGGADGVRVHTLKSNVPSGALLQIRPSVFATSPELTFILAARSHDFLHQLMIGYELCGCYSLRPDLPGGMIQRHPLCSPKTISQVLSRMGSFFGGKQAREALRYLRAGSGSPRETALALLLCLPGRHGGYGLPLPELNRSIEMKSKASVLWARGNAFDMVWTKEKLVVEYDGRTGHEGFEAHERDSQRRAALVAAGYSVVVVTKSQMNDSASMFALAKTIAGKLGKRLRPQAAGFEEKHERLRRTVTFSH